METTIYLALALLFGVYMAWGIGANDIANAMATSIGSKAITFKQAILIAALFEFLGATLAGAATTDTIRKGIVEVNVVGTDPQAFIHGMLAALLGCAIWLNIASAKGWPVSTTHSIVGGIIGFAVVHAGVGAVNWSVVSSIAMSWLASPLTSGLLAFITCLTVQRLVLNRPNPAAAAQRWVPFYIFLTGFFLTLVTVTKGLKHVGLDLTLIQAAAIAFGIGLLVALAGRRIVTKRANQPNFNVESAFAVLMLFTACGMAFAHGSNDVANAIGPMAAVLEARDGKVGGEAIVPWWMLLLGGAGMVIGLMTYGKRVIAVVGQRITALTPSMGFAAELAAAMTVVVASKLGMPISTTHTLIGAVIGVGLAQHSSALNGRVIARIFASWLVTLPAGAGLTILCYFALQAMFS